MHQIIQNIKRLSFKTGQVSCRGASRRLLAASRCESGFSELVRKARSEGPQHVTVHGRDEVVVVTAESYRRLKGSAIGQALIDAMQASPHRDVELKPTRSSMPARDVANHHGLTVVSRDTDQFLEARCSIVNPWDDSPQPVSS
jgi:prevent-host-death family protein